MTELKGTSLGSALDNLRMMLMSRRGIESTFSDELDEVLTILGDRDHH